MNTGFSLMLAASPIAPGILLLAAGCVAIPLILYVTGLVALRVAGVLADRSWAAPLAGTAVWCLTGTYAIMTRTPVWAWFAVLVAAVIALGAQHWRTLTLRTPEALTYLLVYLFTLGVMCVVPFPGMWLMGGDWVQHYGMASAVWERSFGVMHLARSPSFAAGAIVCLPFRPGLAAYQIYGAATSSAALLVLLAGARTPGALARRRWVVASLAVSAFYVVHLQNLWPKWIAAGAFVAAILEAMRYRQSQERSTVWLTMFWFGFGIAAHESTAFAFPFLFVAFGRTALRTLVRQPLVWAVGALLCVATFAGWQAWTLATYGYKARAEQNPMTTWHEERSWPMKVARNAVDHTVGLLVPDLVENARTFTSETTRQQRMETVAYLGLALNSWMAATLLTIFGPSVWVLRGEIRAFWRDPLRTREVRMWGAALAATFALNCLILPTAPRYGAAQAGFVPVCLLGFFALLVEVLEQAPAVRLRRIARWHILTGLGPFAVLALGVLLVMHLPHAGRDALVEKLAKADLDFNATRDLGLEILSAKFFPSGLVVFVSGLALLWNGALSAAGQNVRTRSRRDEDSAAW